MPYNEKGEEILDDTPVAMPVGWRKPPTLQEQIRMYIRNELSGAVAEAGQESFEDADDFDVDDDDPELRSKYELDAEVERLERWNELGERERAVAAAEERLARSAGNNRKARAGDSHEELGSGEVEEDASDVEQKDAGRSSSSKGNREVAQKRVKR